MTETLYLILHKVRGEPAFDIATQLEVGAEEGLSWEKIWIIPTSGHRAYPWYAVALKDLHLGTSNIAVTSVQVQDLDMSRYQDHYAASEPIAKLTIRRATPATATEDFLL